MKTIILNTDSLLNPGDAAIVLAQILLLQKLLPGLQIALTSRTPDLDRGFFGLLGIAVHPPLLPAPSLWRGAGRKLLGSARHASRIGDKIRLIREIRSSDFVISCGGGPFYSNRRRWPGLTFAQNVFQVRLAQAWGKPVLFFPQSFGPFGSAAARRTVRRLLGHPRTARILVREPISAEALARMLPAAVRARVELCPDMVFGLPPGPLGGVGLGLETMPRPRLALSVRDWDFPEAAGAVDRSRLRESYLESVRAAALRFCRESRGSIAIVPHTRGPGDFEDDRIISRILWQRLQQDLPAGRLALLDLPDEMSPLDLISLYARADLILATRTHAAIFGLLAGRSVVSIHYQPKGLGILGSVGLAARTLPIADCDAASLLRILEEAAGQTTAETARITARIGQLREEIEIRIARTLDEVAGRR
jgi:colanic acid/amylovoran biosynthesis protein